MGESSAQHQDQAARLEALRRYVDEQVDENFLRRHGAHSVAIKHRKGKDGAEEWYLALYVARDAAPGLVGPPDAIHFTDLKTQDVIDVPVVVVKASRMRFDAGPAVVGPDHRVPGGVDCCAQGDAKLGGTTGTLGGWACDKDDNTVVLLSNMHILGEDKGRVIFHPAPSGKGPGKEFGKVKRGRWATDDGKMQVDCAIGEADDPERAHFAVLNVGPAIMATAKPRKGLKVEKMGGTTDHTRGTINAPVYKGFTPNLDDGEHLITNCFLIEPTSKQWADGGDSGSLVFSSEKLPGSGGIKPVVGLHFGSVQDEEEEDESKRPWLGVACRIHRVFDALHLETLPRGLVRRMLLDMRPGLSNSAQEDGLKTLAAVHEGCAKSANGRRVLTVLDEHRAELVTLLSRDSDLRSAAVAALRPIFEGEGNLEVVMNRPIDAGAVTAFAQFADLLDPHVEPDLREALSAWRESLPKPADNKTMADYLKPS